MNLEQLEAKHKELGEEIAKLKAEQTEAEWPKKGDVYWIADDCGANEVIWTNHDVDRGYYSTGNCFRTEAEAQSEYETRKVIAELRRQLRAKKFVPGENNCGVDVQLKTGEVGCAVWLSSPYVFGHAYFNEEVDVLNAIETVGKDRILKAAKWLACGEVW